MTSLRQEEAGGVEVNDEIRELLRRMNTAPAPEPEMVPLPAPPTEQGASADGEGR
jgi:hypothetical protein